MNKTRFHTFFVSAFLIMACQEKRMEPEAPKELSGDAIEANANSQDAWGKNEGVSPPAQIAGSYLKATLLVSEANNTGWQTQIALNVYCRNKRVQDNPKAYTVSISAAHTGAAQGIRISETYSSSNGYDQILTIQGPNQAAIENAYNSIMLYTTVVDKSDYSSMTLSSSLSEIIGRE